MKKSDLRNIIKEELKKIIKEDHVQYSQIADNIATEIFTEAEKLFNNISKGNEVKLNDINRIPELCKYLIKELKKRGTVKWNNQN